MNYNTMYIPGVVFGMVDGAPKAELCITHKYIITQLAQLPSAVFFTGITYVQVSISIKGTSIYL